MITCPLLTRLFSYSSLSSFHLFLPCSFSHLKPITLIFYYSFLRRLLSLSWLSLPILYTMTTSFTALPIVDLAPLTSDHASEEDLRGLSARLHEVFATVGFAYLINVPSSFSHEEVFGAAKQFFALPEEVKMGVAKKTFRRANKNTYRGCVYHSTATFRAGLLLACRD